MNLEEQKNVQEEIKTPEAKPEAPAIKPEELSEQMASQSQKEVTDFQAAGKTEINNIEKSAAADGLAVDENDKKELGALSQEAIAAKNELANEIGLLERMNETESKEKKLEFLSREKQLKLEELQEVAMIANEYIKKHANKLGIQVVDFSSEKIDWVPYYEKYGGVCHYESGDIEVKSEAKLDTVIHEIIHYCAIKKKGENGSDFKNLRSKSGFHSIWNPKNNTETNWHVLRGLNEAVTDKLAKEIFQREKKFLVSDMQNKYPETAEKMKKLAEDKKTATLEEIRETEEAGEEVYRSDENNLFLMGSFEEFIEEEKERVLDNYKKDLEYIPGQSYVIEDNKFGYKDEIKALDAILDKLAEKRSKDEGISLDEANKREWEDLQKAFFQGNTLYLRRFEKIVGSGTLRLFDEIDRNKIAVDERKKKVEELIGHIKN